MTVKESFNVAGLPTTFGNPLWKDNIAAENAFLIDRLLQAGAILFGKTNVPYMLADASAHRGLPVALQILHDNYGELTEVGG